MSEPVTNVEIEDVLSSIRKLVSDGDKARTRDPVHTQAVPEATEDFVQPTESKSDKLVLTPAFLVVETADNVAEAPEEQDAVEEIEAEVAPENDEEDLAPPIDDMVWEDVDSDARDEVEDASVVTLGERPQMDRSSLAATIAELEAAVSSDSSEYEPDGSEVMTEAATWPESAMREIDAIEDAEASTDAPLENDPPLAEELVGKPEEPVDFPDAQAFEEEAFEPNEEPIAFSHRAPEETTSAADEDAAADVYQDDDIDDLLDAGAIQLDDAALRQLVSDVVKEELTGPLGERITRNVRKLVRREIYRILSSKEFD